MHVSSRYIWYEACALRDIHLVSIHAYRICLLFYMCTTIYVHYEPCNSYRYTHIVQYVSIHIVRDMCTTKHVRYACINTRHIQYDTCLVFENKRHVQLIVDRVTLNLEIILQTFLTHQNCAHGIYGKYQVTNDQSHENPGVFENTRHVYLRTSHVYLGRECSTNWAGAAARDPSSRQPLGMSWSTPRRASARVC